MKRIIRKLFRWLPVSTKARLDYFFDRSLGKEFGGPFNGQASRQQIFRDLVREVPFKAIVETGTFRGTTTAFMATQSRLPVHTVEAEPRFYHYAKLKLRRNKNVRVRMGDSRKFIEEISHTDELPHSYVFIYLDAHWQEDLPLFREIELVEKNWDHAAIMIDDFEVPGDPEYKYDDYGNGKKLCLEYISPLIEKNWLVYFPVTNARDETGLKRGCVILVSKDLEEKTRKISSLRSYKQVIEKMKA
ncbi:MAG TPA: hypothetical protein VLJ68_09430 [Chitinophagaceae bacterium]|nr:hypothetical protein [Chitinophagaceae bacterium]